MLDLDGTTIKAGVEVSPRVRKALRRAHEEGCLLVVSTGRPLGMIPIAILRLGVMDYYLCANGAKVYDAQGNELFSRTLSRDKVKLLMSELAPQQPGWNVFSDAHSWIERSGVSYMLADLHSIRAKLRSHWPSSPRQLKNFMRGVIHSTIGERGKSIVDSIVPVVDSHEEFEKAGCSFASDEACAEAVSRIEELGGFQVARVWSRELEITASGVTKGNTCDWLLERLGVERERTVAFGDSMNDASLIGHVGRFVAMGNASEELKDLADESCASLAEDGVAAWIESQIDEALAGADE